jgi:hypothetical protein
MSSVTVDREPLAVADLGFQTVGQVLSHLQRDNNRLVVQVLIDGHEPDSADLPALRQRPLDGHTVYIETADPRRLALDVIEDVCQQLWDADRLKNDAADLLQRNLVAKALEQLGSCIRIWQHAQDCVTKTAELLRIDLAGITVDEQPLPLVLEEFAGQLRSIKSALEQRDFVILGDVLLYETTQTTDDWLSALGSLRAAISGLG